MKIAAIDPGRKGAIAISHDGKLSVSRLKFTQDRLNVKDLAAKLSGVEHLFYETPNKGYKGKKITASTIQKGGFYTGIVYAICAMQDIQLHEYSSSTWMGEFFGSGAKCKNDNQKPSIDYCIKKYDLKLLMPGRCTTVHDGITDALCLLEFGSRKLEQNDGS